MFPDSKSEWKKMGNRSEFHSERNYYLQNWYFSGYLYLLLLQEYRLSNQKRLGRLPLWYAYRYQRRYPEIICCPVRSPLLLNILNWLGASLLENNEKIINTHLPYVRHHNPRLVYYFKATFWKSKKFLRGFFRKILALCMVSIQERFIIKNGLWWRTYGSYFYFDFLANGKYT